MGPKGCFPIYAGIHGFDAINLGKVISNFELLRLKTA